MTTIYSLCYPRTQGHAITSPSFGPSIADFWFHEHARRACPSDCTVIAREVPESYAEVNCED